MHMNLLMFTVIAIIVMGYIIEVGLGSHVGVFNSFIGESPKNQDFRQINNRQFFMELLPLIIISIGFPLLLSFLFK